MTLPLSGPISLNQIRAEFGMASTTVFPTDFYGKGGAPASGALSLYDFYGRSNGSGLTASASPSSVDGAGSGTTVDTISTTATPSGGTPPYTYAWQKNSGDAVTAISPTSATTAFRGSAMSSGEIRNATFFCVVTDSSGTPKVAVTNMVFSAIERT